MTVKRYVLSGDQMVHHKYGRWVHTNEFDALAAELAECRARLAEAERLIQDSMDAIEGREKWAWLWEWMRRFLHEDSARGGEEGK
jgi:hypothetical protein